MRVGLGIAALLVMLAAPMAQAAEILLGNAAEAGGTLEVPILLHLEHNEAVSGLQFEIVLDPATAKWEGISAGSAATAAGKMLSFNAVDATRYRVIVAGFNQSVLLNGSVALLRLSASSAQAQVRLENPVMSDPEGHAVNSSATGGSLQGGKSAPTTNAPPPPPAKARPACGCGAADTTSYPGSGDLLVVVSTMLLLLFRWRSAPRRA